MEKASARAVAYLATRSSADRRALGVVYTPTHLVEFVLDLAGYVEDKPLEGVRLIDPACGAGIFLVGAIRRLARSIEKRGVAVRTSQGARVLAELASENLVGVDVDPRACRLTRSALLSSFHELTDARGNRNLALQIVCADFLRSRTQRGMQAPHTSPNLVVGNPPYVATTRLTVTDKESFRRRFKTAHGRIDLYQLFFERALEILSPGGRVAFITPNKFLTSHSGSRLRGLLLRSGAVLAVANFRSHRVFSDAATVPCVTVVEKNGEAADLMSLQCGERPGQDGRVTVLRSRPVSQRALSSEPWELGEEKLLALSKRLLAGHTLEQHASRISAGWATGLDSLFVIPSTRTLEIEDELLRPAIRGRDIDAFNINAPGLHAIVPYHFGNGATPKLVDLTQYPKTKRYLSRQRARLVARHCVRVWNKKWYDLHDPVSFDVTKTPKIVVPDIADRSRFALDEGGYLPLHSAYYIVPADSRKLDFLVALLNSTALTFLVRFRSPVVKDGFSRYRRQFLAELPIPQVDSRAAREIARAGQEQDLDLLDSLVCCALGITAQEAAAMRRFLRQARGRRHSENS